MAEAVAVISLFSNIVSLVQFGGELIERISAFTSNLDEVPATFRTLKLQLPLLVDNLHRTKKHAENSSISNETASALNPIIESCAEELKCITNILDKVLPATTVSSWTRWRAAVKSFAYDKPINKSIKVLDKNIQYLIHYHVASSSEADNELLVYAQKQQLRLSLDDIPTAAAIRDLRHGFETLLGSFDQVPGMLEQLEGLQLNQPVSQAALDDELARILKWINAVDTTDTFQDALMARATGTCNWIFENPAFVKWSNSDTLGSSSKALWLRGPPGFGKSVLCASIAEELRQRATATVAYFFCAAEDESRRLPGAILRSWVSQLMEKNTTPLNVARQFYRDKTASRATEQELWTLFESLGPKAANCFFIVDGFDECDERIEGSKLHITDLKISFLRRLLESSAKFPCQILLVSRYDISIKSIWNSSLHSTSTEFYEYEINERDTLDDVNVFSALTVKQRLPNKKDGDMREITRDIVQRCDGMFLWVRLLEQKLSPGKNLRELRTIISSTPSDIDTTYARELERIIGLDEDDKYRALAILRWTLFATRPLTVQEMTEALLVDINPEFPPQDCSSYPTDALPDEYDEYYVDDRIRRLCGPLISLRSSDPRDSVAKRTIHFVHFSVQEYLLKVHVMESPQFSPIKFRGISSEHTTLCRACICYLLYSDWEKKLAAEGLKAVVHRYPFLDYAAKSWSVHASQGITSDQKLDSLLKVRFHPEHCKKFFPTQWKLWSRIFEGYNDFISYEPWDDENPDHGIYEHYEYPDQLYYASLFGLVSVAESLILQGTPLNNKGGIYGTALHAAAKNHHEDVVCLLLKHDANVNATFGVFGSALIIAIAHGSDERGVTIARLLLDAGADVTSVDTTGKTAVHYAAWDDKINAIELLLERGANLDSKDYTEWTALHIAAVYGCLDAAALLLQKGSSVDERTNADWTALHMSAGSGQHGAIAILLKHGAQIDATGKNGATALTQAAENKQLACVELLLHHGAKIEFNQAGKSALSLAASNGSEEIVRILLGRGAECRVGSGGGKSLIYAARDGHLEIAKMLLEAGADVSAADDDGYLALHKAAFLGHVEVIELLRDHGADLEAEGAYGIKPLHAAIGHDNAFNKLVELGANLNYTMKDGANYLYSAAYEGKESIIQQLLDAGLDVNSATVNGSTALWAATYSGNVAAVKLLLDAGAKVNNADSKGESALHTAARRGYASIATLLLDSGADLNATTEDNFTALHLAAARGHVDVVKILLDRGMDPNALAVVGFMPLHLAAASGHSDVVEMLLHHGATMEADPTPLTFVLSRAAAQGYIGVLHLFCEHGAEVNVTGETSATALHYASLRGDRRVVDVLLQFGADPNLQMQMGLTALHAAIYGGHRAVIKSIMAAAPNVGLLDRYGRTCLDWTSLHPPTHSQMLEHYPEYKPTDETTKTEILRNTVRGLVQRVSTEKTEYNSLGHCLIFLGELQEACTAFEQEITTLRTAYKIEHHVICSNCPSYSISGDRNVCLACPDIDLCKNCKEEVYDQESDELNLEMCRGHRFLKVPADGWDQLPEGHVNSRGESEEQWLERLTTMVG